MVTWSHPDDVAGGGEQDILDAAKRQLELILHSASINSDLIESLWRSLTHCRRLMIVVDDIDRDAGRLTKALHDSGTEVADLVLWRQLLDTCQVPGAVLTAEGLELTAFVLLMTGQREIRAPATAHMPISANRSPPPPTYPARRIDQRRELRRLKNRTAPPR
jgi:hypothetical protein